MTETRKSWLATADARQAKLFHVSRTDQGSSHVEERAAIKDDWEGHEHGRPSARTDSHGHSYASEGHETDEQLQRFARKVGAWLEERLEEHGIDQAIVFCPPRFLGSLRKTWSPALLKRTEAREVDLSRLDAGALAVHPAVVKAMGLSPA